MIATNQRSAPMLFEVIVPGFHAPIPVRNRWIADAVRKSLARKYGTLDITVRERSGR